MAIGTIGTLVMAATLATQAGEQAPDARNAPNVRRIGTFYGRLYGVDGEGRLIIRQYRSGWEPGPIMGRVTHRIRTSAIEDVSNNYLGVDRTREFVRDCPLDSVVAAVVSVPDGGGPIGVKIWMIRKKHADWLVSP